MGTYDYTIIGATVCGIIMVLGGIVLLYKGAIRLEVAARDPALTVEMFQSEFKLTTRVPALGLFVIGLCFVVVSIYFGRDIAATPIEVVGVAEQVDEPVTVLVKSEWGVPALEGQVHHVLRPQLDVLWVVVSAPGYRPYVESFSRDRIKQGVDFGKVRLQRVVERIPARSANIRALPPGVNAPPLTEAGRFGAAGAQ
jgi:hypothetical protein